MGICALACRDTSKLCTQSPLHIHYKFASSVFLSTSLIKSSEPAPFYLHRRSSAPRCLDTSALINSLEACGRTTNLEFHASTGSAALLMPNVCTAPHTLPSPSHLSPSQFVHVSLQIGRSTCWPLRWVPGRSPFSTPVFHSLGLHRPQPRSARPGRGRVG